MIKKIIVSFYIFVSLFALAQESTSSPYSFYGIGEIRFKGTVENRSMGTLSIFRDSLHLNLQNPASLSRLNFTTFAVGASTNSSILATATSDNVTKRTTIDYIAVGLPLGKFGVNFGLMPYSAVGYKIAVNNLSNDVYLKKYDGTGGVNRVFLGFGYNFNNNFSAGLNIESNFGKITSNSVQYYNNVQYGYGTREYNNSNVSGVSTKIGLMYNTTLKSKIQYDAGLTFEPQSNLTFTNQRVISTEQPSINSQLTIDFKAISVPESVVKLPSKLSIGFGLGENRKWKLGTEIVFQSATNFGNRFNDINNVGFEAATQYKLGGFFIPKYNSFTSYFKRVTYRGGFNYQNSGLIVNGKSIKEQNITLGLGLPLGGAFSNLNIGFEFGKRGTKLAGLVLETYNNLTIGLSLNDKWFVKRRFD
ncbi:MAG: hypothetical protein H7174_09610 [Flavobacterium sp.]|nr:hypothetical protein [Flavobacterium sp.]